MAILLRHIREAAERIRPVAQRTPVFTSRCFEEQAGLRAFFKCENFQRGGAFKIRGAANFIYSLSKEQLSRGVVSYSSGNHAQAVAIAAESIGAKATLVMPSDAPRSKVEATRAYGATIVTYDRLRESREEIGRGIAKETGAALAPPYDHPWTIAGQGTTALELLEEVPELDALVVPIGGGGLISGCSIAGKDLRPEIRVFGVEPEEANDTYLSLRADLRATRPGEVTFPVVQRLVEEIVPVSEDEIKATVRFLLTRLKIVAEPSGAVAAAAALFHKLPRDIRSAGIIISGGNVDLDQLAAF